MNGVEPGGGTLLDTQAPAARQVGSSDGPSTQERLIELDRAACLAYLRTVPVGRLVLSRDGLSLVVPVNFVVLHDAVYLRTATASQAARAAEHDEYVTFEADDYDREGRYGWSVVVRGRARTAAQPDLRELERSDLLPWSAGDRPRVVRVSLDLVEGRRVGGPMRLQTSQYSSPGLTGSQRGRVEALMATTAVSGQQTPWTAQWGPAHLDVRLAAQAVPAQRRAGSALVWCGAAAELARLALRGLGHDARLEHVDEPRDERLVARLVVGPRRPPSRYVEELVAAAQHRAGLVAGRGPAASAALLDELRVVAEQHGAWLVVAGRPAPETEIGDDRVACVLGTVAPGRTASSRCGAALVQLLLRATQCGVAATCTTDEDELRRVALHGSGRSLQSAPVAVLLLG